MPQHNGAHTGAEIDSAVQSIIDALNASAYDSTAGRLLKVFDHGVGAIDAHTIPDKSLDDFDWKQATYRVLPSNGGVRPPLSGDFVMDVKRHGNVECWQIARYPGGRVFARFYSGGLAAWNPWFEEYNEISAGGIERGSNANGEYTKYPDGTLICWANVGDVFAGQSTITWTFPHAFSSLPVYTSAHLLLGPTVNPNSNAIQPTFNGTDQNSGQFTANVLAQYNVRAFAIGRWK